jgi:RHS repeat-associated protein
MTTMPSSVVAGVSIISGDYIESDQEYSVSGSEPYTIGHTYVSSSLAEGSLGTGWNFIHEHILQIHQPAAIHYTSRDGDMGGFDNRDHAKNRDIPNDYYSQKPPRPDKKHVFAHLDEPFGGRLTFEGRFAGTSHHPELKNFKVKTKHTSYTNTATGKISAHSNIKNITLHWNEKNDSWQVLLGDGTIRTYSRQWQLTEKKDKGDRVYAKYNRDYHLVKEKLPSGNCIKYEYNQNHELEWMRLFGKKGDLQSFVHFKQKSKHAFAKKPSLHVTNSDNIDCYYDFTHLQGKDQNGEKLKDSFAVSGITRPDRPYVRFLYDEKSDNHIRRLERKACEDGSFIEIKYYRPHDNDMGNGEVRTLSSKEAKKFNKNRVRYLKMPYGKNGEVIRTHAFKYYSDGKKGGYADVYDALNQRTRYRWNEDKRLTHIERYTNSNSLVMAEEFVWGKEKLEGHLTVSIIYDEEYKPKLAHTFSYDTHGNILEETRYGRFTKNSGTINVKNLSESTCDRCTTRYTYSKDRFNLKTSECDPDDNYTYYEYVKNTNLLKATFICDKKKICKREFYSYDDNALLVEKIVDDGSTKSKDDLTDSTERHITRITPRTSYPHFGEPESIQEYYYSVAKKHEVYLKKTVNHFDKRGLVKKQQIFDNRDKLQQTTYYESDDLGRITYKEDASGKIERCSYDSCGRVCKKQLATSTTSYFYDVAGRLIREEEEIAKHPLLIKCYEYDNLGRKIKEIDPQSNETLYEYDLLNRITKISYPAIYDRKGNSAIPTKHFEYKKLGTIKIETDENGHKTTTVYSAAGKVFERELPDATKHTYQYDKKGNLVLEIAPNGTEQKLVYDAFNRLIKQSTVHEGKTLSKRKTSYNSFHTLTETSPTGEIIRYSYDKAGRKKAKYINDVYHSSYHYDSCGRLFEERIHVDKKHYYCTRYEYDALGRVISESIRDDSDKIHSYKLVAYDIDGNCSETKIPVNGTEAVAKTQFLAHGLPIKSVDAQGNCSYYDYDFYYLNKHGQRVCKKTSIDPRGVSQSEVYDAKGNLSEIITLCPFGTLLAKKEFFYDAASNCTEMQDYAILHGSISNVITTSCTYGPNKRLETIVEGLGTPEEKVTQFLYNRLGQKKAVIHADKKEIRYKYDYKGRLEAFFANDNSLHYTYAYDNSDRIVSVINKLTGNQTTRRYDSFGELASETLENDVTLSYSYDITGRLEQLILPDNSSISYDYSPVMLKTVRRLNSQHQELWKHTITERALSGKVLQCQLPMNAGTLVATHDELLQVTSTTHDAHSQNGIVYDAVGNMLELKTSDSVGKIDALYQYDYLSQLVSEKSHVSHSYLLNSLHDRLGLDDKKYKVNSLHSVLTDSVKNYTYDARGNRISDGNFTYCYDALDRLIKVQTSDGSYTTYSYDAFDRRIEKCSFAKDSSKKDQTKYIYALQNEIGAVDSSGDIIELRILGEATCAEIGASVGIELKGTLYVPIHDIQGSISMLLDADGKIVESYRYDAFGCEEMYDAQNNKIQKSHIDNPWRFSSKRTDSETGFVYFGRRYYDPQLGKWLTMDPLGLKAGPNLYAYVLNNPLTHIDLYGLEDEPTADRSIWDRVGDVASDVCRRVRDIACKVGEEIVHNLPHIGSFNNDVEDKLRSIRGASEKDRSICLKQVHKGTPSASGCRAIVHVNGVECSAKEAIKNAEHLKDPATGQLPDIYALQVPSNGICMDFLRALLNVVGIETSDIAQIRECLQELATRYPEGGIYLSVHSQGGMRTCLASRKMEAETLKRFTVDGFGASHQFNTSDGFSKYRNIIARSDYVAWISDPIGVIGGILNNDGTTQFVGSIFRIPFLSHPYRGSTYGPIVKNQVKAHTR